MTEKMPVLWLTEADVASLVTLNDTIDALEDALKALGKGEAFNIQKALAAYGDGSSMHSLGSGNPSGGYVGFKNWVFTKKGATAVYTMFDSANGSLVAIIEAAVLGQLRTSAICGVATRWMAAADADQMALIGTGSQAFTQAISVALVRKLKKVRVFGRAPDKRAALVQRLAAELKCPVVSDDSVHQATEGASIVTIVTRAQEPFVSADMLPRGAHVNAIGAILPKNAEFSQDVFDRCSVLAADDLQAVKANSREFRERFADTDGWATVATLGELIAAGKHRPRDADLTLFKAMGMGASDLAVAKLALERARRLGRGRPFEQAVRSELRWEWNS